MKQTQVSNAVIKTKSEDVSASFEADGWGKSESGLSLEDDEIMAGTQDLIREIELEELNGGSNNSVESKVPFVSSSSNVKEQVGEKETSSVSVDLANQLAMVDSRMVGFLQNLQNSGNITININLDRK